MALQALPGQSINCLSTSNMTTEIEISITPEGATASALAQAHREQQASGDTGAKGKARRTHHDFTPRGSRSVVRITRVEASAKHPHASYRCEANAAELLVGLQAFSAGSLVAHIVPILFALFKLGLRAMLPSVPAKLLEEITPDQCKLETLTLPFYFDLEDPTEAYRAWLRWHQHLKVVFDGPSRLPLRSNTPQVLPVRVAHDSDCRDAFIAQLPFGQSRFFLKRDIGHVLAAKPDVQTVEQRKEMLAFSRRLLCVEVTVDLALFRYTNSIGLDVPLPQDYRLWVPSELPDDPMKTIWNRFRWECWLEADLLNESTEIPACLGSDNPATAQTSSQRLEIMQAYFDGQAMQRHPQFDGDIKKFIKSREVLIAKAGIDILNPWSVAQLNLCQSLSPKFSFEARFLPHEHELFAPHSLTKQGIGAAIQRLHSSLQDEPGWAFDIARYEGRAA